MNAQKDSQTFSKIIAPYASRIPKLWSDTPFLKGLESTRGIHTHVCKSMSNKLEYQINDNIQMKTTFTTTLRAKLGYNCQTPT